MMNNFVVSQFPAKMLFHDISMLSNRPAVYSNNFVVVISVHSLDYNRNIGGVQCGVVNGNRTNRIEFVLFK